MSDYGIHEDTKSNREYIFCHDCEEVFYFENLKAHVENSLCCITKKFDKSSPFELHAFKKFKKTQLKKDLESLNKLKGPDNVLYDEEKYRKTTEAFNPIICKMCGEMINREANNKRGGAPIKNCLRCKTSGRNKTPQLDANGVPVLNDKGEPIMVSSGRMQRWKARDFPEHLIEKYGRLTKMETNLQLWYAEFSLAVSFLLNGASFANKLYFLITICFDIIISQDAFLLTIISLRPVTTHTKINRTKNGTAKSFQQQTVMYKNGSVNLIKKLPLLPSECKIFKVSFENQDCGRKYNINPEKILAYGEWLCKNNKAFIYHKIEIQFIRCFDVFLHELHRVTNIVAYFFLRFFS